MLTEGLGTRLLFALQHEHECVYWLLPIPHSQYRLWYDGGGRETWACI